MLKPGETFTLNDTVGERTAENGFTEGFIISDGIFKEDLGGGVSQMATTTFNAMFFAGLEDVEHKPHSFYIDRYPVGREATVAWGAVDLRFSNDTPYGVLIQRPRRPRARPSRAGRVTVRMWSTKYWDITADDLRPLQRHLAARPGTLSGAGLLPEHRATAASTSTSTGCSSGTAARRARPPRDVSTPATRPSDTVICS